MANLLTLFWFQMSLAVTLRVRISPILTLMDIRDARRALRKFLLVREALLAFKDKLVLEYVSLTFEDLLMNFC